MVMALPPMVAVHVAGGLAGAFLAGDCWARSVVAANSKPVQIKTRFMRCFSSRQSLFCVHSATKSRDRARNCVAPSFRSPRRRAPKVWARMLSIGRINRDGPDALIVASRGPLAEAVFAAILL